jgi:hypothetical protein
MALISTEDDEETDNLIDSKESLITYKKKRVRDKSTARHDLYKKRLDKRI